MNKFKEAQNFIDQARNIIIDPRGILTFSHIENNRITRSSPVSSYELNTTVYPNFEDVVAFRIMFMEGKN